MIRLLLRRWQWLVPALLLTTLAVGDPPPATPNSDEMFGNPSVLGAELERVKNGSPQEIQQFLTRLFPPGTRLSSKHIYALAKAADGRGLEGSAVSRELARFLGVDGHGQAPTNQPTDCFF